ncbi:hypothetical protein C8R45DRAFT_144731 [Mycena sanguinolenta]|nr:hypothetical protein C8R45DRAFT_144731 [Mycena sanguinolenta]
MSPFVRSLCVCWASNLAKCPRQHQTQGTRCSRPPMPPSRSFVVASLKTMRLGVVKEDLETHGTEEMAEIREGRRANLEEDERHVNVTCDTVDVGSLAYPLPAFSTFLSRLVLLWCGSPSCRYLMPEIGDHFPVRVLPIFLIPLPKVFLLSI